MNVPDRDETLNALGLLALVAVVVPFVVFAVPQVAGADHSYVVLSGSMNPTYQAGDVILVGETPSEQIETGDVITFRTSPVEGTHGYVTHRVVTVVEKDGDRYFRTKGDANEEPDKELVPASNVVGRVQFAIPYVGHAVSFANRLVGKLSLVVVPIILFVANEVWTFVRSR